MAFTVNGELVEDSVIRAEASALRPRYAEVAQNMDPIEAEMQLREWSRENVIERVLLRTPDQPGQLEVSRCFPGSGGPEHWRQALFHPRHPQFQGPPHPRQPARQVGKRRLRA